MNLTLGKHLNGPKNEFGGKKNALKYSDISGNKLNVWPLELLERLQLQMRPTKTAAYYIALLK